MRLLDEQINVDDIDFSEVLELIKSIGNSFQVDIFGQPIEIGDKLLVKKPGVIFSRKVLFILRDSGYIKFDFDEDNIVYVITVL